MTAIKNVELSSMMLQRKALGILCTLLAPCCILFGLIGCKTNLPLWYLSISATYYANSKIFMIGLLFATSVFFFSYKGYDWKDRTCSIIQAISSLGIIIFPCYTEGAPNRVGLFNLPIELSHVFHCIMTVILFLTFAINVIFLFTLSNNEPTEQKKIRNKIYYTCGGVIVLFMIIQVISVLLNIIPKQFPTTLINEFIMLEAYGFAYIVKSSAIEKFNDK